jgi:Fic family protein
MTLNKSSSYVLLNILAGRNTAAMISEHLTNIDIRSIQRSLTRLVELGVIKRNGTNNPTYDTIYEKLISTEIPDKLIIDEDRPESSLNFDLIDWLKSIPESELESALGLDKIVLDNLNTSGKMTAKDLEYLTVELSWKSSALEGNTYTLLDTQLLLLEGIKAKDKTEFETQMILNHKNAISFIVENSDLFKQDIKFSTLEELHRIISHNLGIDSGLRKKIIRISASNYRPLSNPHQLREHADSVLRIISNINNPVLRALIALALIPYLQTFEDGNKRTGRMLANGILIHSISRGFSLRRLTARQLALAYLSFYEFNSLQALSDLLVAELSNPI